MAENKINFVINNEKKLANAVENIEFQGTQGWFDFVIDSKNLTKDDKGRTVADDRIIEFAAKCSSALVGLLKSETEEININHGSYPCVFKFRKESDNVYCSLYDETEKEYQFKDEKMQIKEFFTQYLNGIKNLEDSMSINPFYRDFKLARSIMNSKYNMFIELAKLGILTKEEIRDIFNNRKKNIKQEINRFFI